MQCDAELQDYYIFALGRQLKAINEYLIVTKRYNTSCTSLNRSVLISVKIKFVCVHSPPCKY